MTQYSGSVFLPEGWLQQIPSFFQSFSNDSITLDEAIQYAKSVKNEDPAFYDAFIIKAENDLPRLIKSHKDYLKKNGDPEVGQGRRHTAESLQSFYVGLGLSHLSATACEYENRTLLLGITQSDLTTHEAIELINLKSSSLKSDGFRSVRIWDNKSGKVLFKKQL